MIVRNGGESLRRALHSARFCDEIIVVDTGSTDDSKQIASEFGAKIYDFEWTGSFSDARNYALERCTGDWVLTLDHDEELSPEAIAVIPKLIQGTDPHVSIVRQLGVAVGHEHWSNARLFPREGARWVYRVHEQIHYPAPKTWRLDRDLIVYHYGDVTASAKNDLYLQLAKQDYEESGDLHCALQYAHELSNRDAASPEAMVLFYDLKERIPQERLALGLPLDAASLIPVYQKLLNLLFNQRANLICEAHERGIGGWWSALEYALILFSLGASKECLDVCMWAKQQPWDGRGIESVIRGKIDLLMDWAIQDLGITGNDHSLSELDTQRLECQ